MFIVTKEINDIDIAINSDAICCIEQLDSKKEIRIILNNGQEIVLQNSMSSILEILNDRYLIKNVSNNDSIREEKDG